MAPTGDDEVPAGGSAPNWPSPPPAAPPGRPPPPPTPQTAPPAPLYPHLPLPPRATAAATPPWAAPRRAGPRTSAAAGPPGRPGGTDGPFLERPGAVPATRSDGMVWVLLALVGFVLGQFVGLAFIYGVAGILGQVRQVPMISVAPVPPEWFVAASLVGLWVGLFGGAYLGSVARGTRRIATDLGIRFRPIDLLGIPIGVGGQIVVALMYAPFIHHIHNFNAPTTKLTGGSHGPSFVVIAVLTVVGAPFFEELFFRGLLFRSLLRLFQATGSRFRTGGAQVMAVGLAVILDGLLFGLAHAELQQLAGLAVFGCILAFVAMRTGRLGMNMVAHASFNLVAVLAIVHDRGGVIH